MTRKQALEWIRIYAAEGNDALAVRVYVENRISRKAFNEAFAEGKRLRLVSEVQQDNA